MSNGINLIAVKNQSVLTPLLNKIKILRAIAISLLFIVSVASMMLFILIALSPLPALKQQKQNSLATLSVFHGDIARLMILNERTNSITSIINNRTNYNTVIDSIRNQIPTGTSIVSLQIAKKTVSVAVASSSLANLNSFLDGIISQTGVKKTFTHATLNNLSLDATSGKYLMVLDLTTL